MARTEATKDYNTFVKGIITEANALTYPENASIDEENFVLKRDGSRQRRLGMDYEEDYTLSANKLNTLFETDAVTVHKWNNADNSGLYNFAVVQIGTILSFYDLAYESLSDGLKAFTVDIEDFKTIYATSIGINPVSGSTGKGVFYVVSKDTEPFYIEYDSSTDTISTTQINMEKRDFIGVDDGLAVDTRPSVSSTSHNYNLQNQGWTNTNITAYNTAQSVHPSNADIWILAKDSNDDFSPALLDKQFFGNTPAPKGHFILDVFNADRNTAAGVSGITTEIQQNRFTSVKFYAGRVFYAGIESVLNTGEPMNGDIYFSRILTEQANAGKCYQDADPTSEEISALLGDDGGVITIPEVGNILKLEIVYNSLVIFADNGVWQITGDSDYSFTATSYQVNKLSNLGAISSSAIVVAESTVFYWADSGIYLITADQVTGGLVVNNITETTIQSLYQSIPSTSKQYATGSYDVISKRVSWLYNSDADYDGATYRYKFNKELVLDSVLQAFYKNTISELSTNSPYVAGVITTPNFLTADVAYNVVVNNVQVQANAVDVQVSLPNPSRGSVSTKYFAVVPQDATNSKVTWALYNNTTFLEWEAADTVGTSFTSFLATGYEMYGDSMRQKSAPYVMTHFSRTETGFLDDGNGNLNAENPSGCLLQARWDWADTATSGRWSTATQAYRLNRNYIPTSAADAFDYGFSVVTTKNKIRGRGKSLGLYLESDGNKDMHILGWSVKATGETTV